MFYIQKSFKVLINSQAESDFELLQSIARSLRQICSSANLPPSARPDTLIHVMNDIHIE